ncbi:protein kinase family protein [Paractinoplanes rishiriensis]|nr:protein kinase family protein [Actinoplanes rishiriensis]
MTFGAPTAGEILAERYQLEVHVNDDSAGRQVWRGIDVVLRRPVAVVLRYPGGDSATEMLQAAVDASRVIHPNLVGVYDAIDEGARAYVVREWVDGESLREMVTEEGPLDPARATAIAHSIGDALAAVHATGMVHGNVHPGTALIADDGRVVLADARADSADTTETDIRAVGGLLYYALTARWPHTEVGQSAVPDATRDASGNLAAPRQIRAGVPAYLDDLTMDLLDKRVAAPDADALAAEMARLDAADDDYDDVGPLRFTQGNGTAEAPRSTSKIMLGVAALLVIAVIGLIFGIRAITSSSGSSGGPTQAGLGADKPNTSDSQQAVPEPQKFKLTEDMVRIVDPPPGDRSDSDEAKLVVDDNGETAWETHRFNTAKFGNLKKGMGVLINLGEPRNLSEISVETSSPGVGMDIRTGTSDPGNNSNGDKKVVETFKRLGEADADWKSDGTKEVFSVFDANTKYQYVLVFITELPRADNGDRFQVSVSEISVFGY